MQRGQLPVGTRHVPIHLVACQQYGWYQCPTLPFISASSDTWCLEHSPTTPTQAPHVTSSIRPKAQESPSITEVDTLTGCLPFCSARPSGPTFENHGLVCTSSPGTVSAPPSRMQLFFKLGDPLHSRAVVSSIAAQLSVGIDYTSKQYVTASLVALQAMLWSANQAGKIHLWSTRLLSSIRPLLSIASPQPSQCFTGVLNIAGRPTRCLSVRRGSSVPVRQELLFQPFIPRVSVAQIQLFPLVQSITHRVQGLTLFHTFET
ncbi:hypothetical protein COCC4DRAFT_29577 [Bipolaris maydis ATCC 48331]|uniref:Uncharacterized protein n=2 Tax=Cochliobolus heterostrophus TaxID=5016 RepID=M2UCA9_COCH5|nr:uncharacterized protein COCC4DRAFT_29577 [Bipolaris maydis ATCC 48331]EMD96204.1 hypothetical protein COCHEDRAFT_1019590 [Bipolaris maydis C5]KAJ5030871.1 hypothetical protein J3E73DRAFT_280565 [Bipolaris maydis]ENI11063.1 hypothetical protein COCC4DRAFT_29577 [Bipolaris maydis ATCC 48331]KAJ5065898.1 hypothetical protein J3E74DRAFT_305785 [Bipolaris maydis]KAJ6201092.1 hypothetical protein J3E72DRAFT_302134 [Bipolaris maydis]